MRPLCPHSGLSALTVVCAKRTARAILLVAQLDAAFSLLQQLIRIFVYARMELLSLLLVLFCAATTIGAILWLAKPEKMVIGAAMCTLYDVFFALGISVLGGDTRTPTDVVYAVGLLALGASIFLRALCPDGSGKKCSYTMLFLVPAVVLKLFTLLFFSVKL